MWCCGMWCQLPSGSLALFNFAVVCDPEQIPAVERALKKCYDHISRLYAYNKAEPVHPGIGLVPSVTAVIVGHWAQDGKLSPEHFQSRVHNAIVYGGTAEELLRTVITLFSYEGQWVIDLLGTADEADKVSNRTDDEVTDDKEREDEPLEEMPVTEKASIIKN
eukprot:Em0001g902a